MIYQSYTWDLSTMHFSKSDVHVGLCTFVSSWIREPSHHGSTIRSSPSTSLTKPLTFFLAAQITNLFRYHRTPRFCLHTYRHAH